MPAADVSGGWQRRDVRFRNAVLEHGSPQPSVGATPTVGGRTRHCDQALPPLRRVLLLTLLPNGTTHPHAVMASDHNPQPAPHAKDGTRIATSSTCIIDLCSL